MCMNQGLLGQKMYGYSATPLILPYDSSHSVDDHIILASDSRIFKSQWLTQTLIIVEGVCK